MAARNIIIGQRVSGETIVFAKQLRHEMTEAERLIWERVRANRLHGLRFRRQQVIDGFIADFYCHSAAVVIEIDGEVHESQKQYDEKRDRVFQERGLKVLRITNEEVYRDLDEVVGRIAAICGQE